MACHPIAREVGLPLPITGAIVNGYEVDFFWPDQAHTAAGCARLRFTHWQVKPERGYVKRILGETAARLA